MNAGLPGAGIGGIFYILFALAIPFKEIYLTLRVPTHRFRYRLVVTQLSIVAGIVLGVVAIYKLVNDVFGYDLSISVQTGGPCILFYSLLPVLISFGLLLIILCSVRLVAFMSSPRELSTKYISVPLAPTREGGQNGIAT